MEPTTGHLLVVDDNEMNRDMLSRRLRKRGHAVEVADGGAPALDAIECGDFDLVLLDIMMPGMDGYEVLERIRERRAADELPVIMATAKSESEDIVRALKLGANDYVTKPFDFPVVMARVTTQVALKRSRDALTAAHHRMKRDLEAAAAIQQTLLPPAELEIEGVRCAWRYVPCDELAGDTLSIIPFDESSVGLYVLDVSGHGVPSSLLSVILSRLLAASPGASSILWHADPESGALRPAPPLEVAEELSRRFPYDEANHQYFTMVYGILDTSRRVLTYVSAGHPHMVRIGRDGVSTAFSSTGPPVALIPSMLGPSIYEQKEISLEPGDRLYIYSDGIPEASNSNAEEFETDRVAGTLSSVLDRDLEGSIAELLDRVWEWGDGQGPDDDVSVLAVAIE